jgi:cytochrome b involved in lipid metabolism
VSSWTDHPGGSLIFTHAGLDATNVFRGFHPAAAHDVLAPFLIGTVQGDADELETDFRALHAVVRKTGLHNARCVDS